MPSSGWCTESCGALDLQEVKALLKALAGQLRWAPDTAATERPKLSQKGITESVATDTASGPYRTCDDLSP